ERGLGNRLAAPEPAHQVDQRVDAAEFCHRLVDKLAQLFVMRDVDLADKQVGFWEAAAQPLLEHRHLGVHNVWYGYLGAFAEEAFRNGAAQRARATGYHRDSVLQ